MSGRLVAAFHIRRSATEKLCWRAAIYRKEGRRRPAVEMLTGILSDYTIVHIERNKRYCVIGTFDHSSCIFCMTA